MVHTGWRAVRMAAVAGGFVLAVPLAAAAAPTNYELVRATAHEVCAKLVQAIGPATEIRVVALRGVGAATGKFLVENTLSAALTEAGWQVFTGVDSAAGRVLEFEVVELGLDYPRSYRNAWLGEKRVIREARARIFARLVDMDGSKVLWADQAEARRRDEVPADQLPVLEEKNPADYVKAALPPARWNRVVEPVVVTGIIAGLIILFFSNQNTSN